MATRLVSGGLLRSYNLSRQLRTAASVFGPFLRPESKARPCLTVSGLQAFRFKKAKETAKKKQTETESSSDEGEEWSEEDAADKSTKLVSVKVASLRADLILKAGLNIARNKIEQLFYESKIRVNGQKLLKKSATVQIGDELDVIKGSSPMNSEFIVVSRLEVLSASEKGEGYGVKLRRNKSLTIEPYETA